MDGNVQKGWVDDWKASVWWSGAATLWDLEELRSGLGKKLAVDETVLEDKRKRQFIQYSVPDEHHNQYRSEMRLLDCSSH